MKHLSTTYSQHRTNDTFPINERNTFQGYRTGYALFGVSFLVSTVQQRHGHNERIQQRTMNMLQRLEYLSIRGLKSWYVSVWRREVWRREGSGISSILTNTWREGAQRTQTCSFQCVHCQKKMQWTWKETLESLPKNQEKCFYTGTGWPEPLWSLLPWRYSKAIQTLWTISSGSPCLWHPVLLRRLPISVILWLFGSFHQK